MATDHMHGMDAAQLLRWILKDLERGSALGIVKELFFTPGAGDAFRMERYGVTLETPIGVAAGPHTQMAQNIIAAWLCGARYIELKTVQVLDQITVAKPCIDMADEGYNCEWSQELSLDGSYEEYLKAWVLLHVLHHRLGFSGRPGMIFNMSAGYSMEGILSPTVQRFLDRMQNCAADVEALKQRLADVYPAAAALDIPGSMSDSLTISCMHGCPPDEVERIALYFLQERKLNTTLKMNPTLLGAQCLRGLLNKTLGYDIVVPDIAFEHDLPYAEAMRIVRNCRAAAAELGVRFSVKLTNTLETQNSGKSLPEKEAMVYMSGRPLHPISIALAELLQKDCNGDLDISFCAGVGALNVVDTLACGLVPVTVCSDLLKPGGYGRLAQYMENIASAMREAEAKSLEDLVCKRAGTNEYKAAVLRNLTAYAIQVTDAGSRYAKSAVRHSDVKTARPLPALDCASAPCMSMCPAGQHIPAYLERAAEGDMDGALAVIMATNPFPAVLGAMCNQACREKCVRVQYDEALRIRDVKGCAALEGQKRPEPAKPCGRRVLVVGADPAGLSCAYYLALAGCEVEVCDGAALPGGPVLAPMLEKDGKSGERVRADIARITALGVRLSLGETLSAERLRARVAGDDSTGYDAVYVADVSVAPLLAGAPYVFARAGSEQPSLVASVGEGGRAAGAIMAVLGLVPPDRGACAKSNATLNVLRRKQAFRQICPSKKLDNGGARAEAARCLGCDRYCGICVAVCPNRANLLLTSPARDWPIQEAHSNGEGCAVRTVATGGMRQERQVMNIGDFCNECGNCAAFCPSAGAPYQAKRRLHLSASSFEADENGVWPQAPGRYRGKNTGRSWNLERTGAGWEYEDETMKTLLHPDSLEALHVSIKNGNGPVSLLPAVEAAVFCELLGRDPAIASLAADGAQRMSS